MSQVQLKPPDPRSWTSLYFRHHCVSWRNVRTDDRWTQKHRHNVVLAVNDDSAQLALPRFIFFTWYWTLSSFSLQVIRPIVQNSKEQPRVCSTYVNLFPCLYPISSENVNLSGVRMIFKRVSCILFQAKMWTSAECVWFLNVFLAGSYALEQ
jgi:hypothetical protein